MAQLPKKLSIRAAGVLTNVILIISNPNKRISQFHTLYSLVLVHII